jgi:hypothetical protein
MFKKKLSEWSMLPAEVEVTHFYGTIFLSPINFFTSFSVTSRKKLDQGGKYYIVSPQAHIQEAV